MSSVHNQIKLKINKTTLGKIQYLEINNYTSDGGTSLDSGHLEAGESQVQGQLGTPDKTMSF